MPIECSISFPWLTQAEAGEIDYAVMHYAFATQRELGSLLDEAVYKAYLSHQLTRAGYVVEREVPIQLRFRNYFKPLFLDLVVNRRLIYEVKAVTTLTDAHVNQLLNYLFLTNSPHGKLINLRSGSVQSRFINSALDNTERRRFQVDTTHWAGASGFCELVLELVNDWGTGLHRSLYTDALTHCLGGEDFVVQRLPMHVEGAFIGSQRFHLMDVATAWRVTTFQELSAHQEIQLRKLIEPSPLKAIYWVNIARHRLTLQTITL